MDTHIQHMSYVISLLAISICKKKSSTCYILLLLPPSRKWLQLHWRTSPTDLVTLTLEWEVQKPNSRTKHGTYNTAGAIFTQFQFYNSTSASLIASLTNIATYATFPQSRNKSSRCHAFEGSSDTNVFMNEPIV